MKTKTAINRSGDWPVAPASISQIHPAVGRNPCRRSYVFARLMILAKRGGFDNSLFLEKQTHLENRNCRGCNSIWQEWDTRKSPFNPIYNPFQTHPKPFLWLCGRKMDTSPAGMTPSWIHCTGGYYPLPVGEGMG
jgi:hypothetical protein